MTRGIAISLVYRPSLDRWKCLVVTHDNRLRGRQTGNISSVPGLRVRWSGAEAGYREQCPPLLIDTSVTFSRYGHESGENTGNARCRCTTSAGFYHGASGAPHSLRASHKILHFLSRWKWQKQTQNNKRNNCALLYNTTILDILYRQNENHDQRPIVWSNFRRFCCEQLPHICFVLRLVQRRDFIRDTQFISFHVSWNRTWTCFPS